MDKDKLKKKYKIRIILTCIVAAIAAGASFFFIIYTQKYYLLFAPFIILAFLALNIVFDISRMKENDKNNEDKPV